MRIVIENLSISPIIGLLESERRNPQKVTVNCTIDYAGEYVDYAKVRELIIREMMEGEFKLIEDALRSIEHKLLTEFRQIHTIWIQILKDEIFNDCRIGVEQTFKR